MTITVERRNVGPRIAAVHVGDGLKAAAEGVEFYASCGCVCIFGRRLDNQETTCAYGPCERHEAESDEFLRQLLADENRETETGLLMAAILDGLGARP